MDFKKLNEYLEIHKPKGGYKENKDFYEKEKIRYIRESPLPKEYFNTTSHMSFKSMPIKNNSTFRFIFYKFLEDRVCLLSIHQYIKHRILAEKHMIKQ